jgi:hypothetical protein
MGYDWSKVLIDASITEDILRLDFSPEFYSLVYI